jgi:hypothetical protein
MAALGAVYAKVLSVEEMTVILGNDREDQHERTSIMAVR